MNIDTVKCSVLALAPAALLAFTSCSSTPPGESATMISTQEGVPGGIRVETYQTTATVAAIDAANRKITLVGLDGKRTIFKAGPEVINFDQIRIGDQVKARVTEQIVIYLATDAPPSDGAASIVALAPKGAKPGGMVAETVQVTTKVTAIDLKRHKATLQFPDGTTRTVAVRPDVDLTQRKVGEEVVIRYTEAVALSVEKP